MIVKHIIEHYPPKAWNWGRETLVELTESIDQVGSKPFSVDTNQVFDIPGKGKFWCTLETTTIEINEVTFTWLLGDKE